MAELLRQHGPMTAKQIAERLAVTKNVIAPVLRDGLTRQLKKGMQAGGQRVFRITAWRRPETSGSLAPVYDIGWIADAPRPPPINSEDVRAYKKAWRAKVKAQTLALKSK